MGVKSTTYSKVRMIHETQQLRSSNTKTATDNKALKYIKAKSLHSSRLTGREEARDGSPAG